MQTFDNFLAKLHRYCTEWLNELGILTKQASARVKTNTVNIIFQSTVPMARFLV